MSRQSQERLQVGVLHLFPVGHVLEVIAADFLQEKSGWNYVAITTGGSSTCFCCCHCSGVNCSRHDMSECDLLVPNTPDRLQTTDFDTCVVVREQSFNSIPCQIREFFPMSEDARHISKSHIINTGASTYPLMRPALSTCH